jgi:hypothetical protein
MHGHIHTYSMDMDMQHGLVHASWTLACSMGMNMIMQHGHATWTCSMDMQHGHRHEAWTWTCIMGMDMQLGHKHSIWT